MKFNGRKQTIETPQDYWEGITDVILQKDDRALKYVLDRYEATVSPPKRPRKKHHSGMKKATLYDKLQERYTLRKIASSQQVSFQIDNPRTSTLKLEVP